MRTRGQGDSLVITYVGQTRTEALRAVEERAGSATYIEVRAASVSVADLERARDVVLSVVRVEPGFAFVGPSYSEGVIFVRVTGDADEAANLLHGKVPGPVRILVKGGVAPATRHDDWLCEAEAAKAWDASGVGPRRRQRG